MCMCMCVYMCVCVSETVYVCVCGDLAMDDRLQFLEQDMGPIFHGPDLLLASVLGLAPLDHVVEPLVEFAQRAWSHRRLGRVLGNDGVGVGGLEHR